MNSASPFQANFTKSIPELLLKLNCSIAISTYQAGKVIFISPKNQDKIIQLPRTFDKPMGMGFSGKKMAIATRNEVIVLGNNAELGTNYPKKPKVYDSFFVPRATYYTGHVDIHDLHWGSDGLYAINTSFSCLVKINDEYSFTPIWQPPFIDKLVSEDRCHLNGLAMENGQAIYATALGEGNSSRSWKKDLLNGGILLDIAQNRILSNELAMPHSPRIYKDKLYTLLSATGQLVEIDRETGEQILVKDLNCFVRGLAIYKDFAFIGKSKIRDNADSFKDLPISQKSKNAGVLILHLPTNKIVGVLEYESSVDEIFDVQVIPNSKRPGIMNTINPDHSLSLVLPNRSFWAKSK